jgi:hypothetical protein
VVYDDENPLQCHVKITKQFEVTDNKTNITMADGFVFFASDAVGVVSAKSLRLTHRERVALGTPEIYTFLGDPKDARTGLKVAIKRVTGEGRL